MGTHDILLKVKNGDISIDEAEQYLRRQPFEEMGYAKLDTHRKIRSGFQRLFFVVEKLMIIC